MNDSLLVAALAGLGGMAGWGMADFFAKKTIDRVGDITSLVWAHLFGTLIFIFFAFYQGVITDNWLTFPSGGLAWLGLAFFGEKIGEAPANHAAQASEYRN